MRELEAEVTTFELLKQPLRDALDAIDKSRRAGVGAMIPECGPPPELCRIAARLLEMRVRDVILSYYYPINILSPPLPTQRALGVISRRRVASRIGPTPKNHRLGRRAGLDHLAVEVALHVQIQRVKLVWNLKALKFQAGDLYVIERGQQKAVDGRNCRPGRKRCGIVLQVRVEVAQSEQ